MPRVVTRLADGTRIIQRFKKGQPIPTTPGSIPGVPLYDPAALVGEPSLHNVVHVAPGLGDSVASMIYSALGAGLAGLARVPASVANYLTPNRSTPTVAQLFSSGGASLSGTDWSGILGGIGQAVAGIYSTKAQTKQLKQLNRLLLGSSAMSFAPAATVPAATVPAATGFGGLLGGALGGLLGGALGLGPDLLPGGLEEGGTGLFGPDLFNPTRAGARQRMIDAVHPTTGERVYWRPVGRPVMFAGDRTLLLRTRKVVRKMQGAAGCGVAGRPFRRRRR